MRLTSTITDLWHTKRPVLRVQLTLLYSGLFLGILAAVLLATGLLYRHSSQQAPPGTPAKAGGLGSGGRAFEVWPALIALIAAAVAVTGAWWLAGRFLRPLQTMTATAQEISANNLNQRLELSGSSDELTALGNTLNDLFARLNATFTAQRHFVANASHELRTPLAGQRTLLQVALADPDADTASLRAACGEALQLGEQQERLIDALLTLASSEQGIQTRQPVDLAPIAETVLASRADTATRLGITLDRSLEPAPATGDPVLLDRLIANLVDNALAHNTPSGLVTVSTDVIDSAARLAVSNTGPIIAAADVEQLFQPFRQTGHQRRGRDGHGLGLAIVRAIAEAHSADLKAQPHPDGGLDIEVRLPAPTNRPTASPRTTASHSSE
jgi:signal transduction histidine kinase